MKRALFLAVALLLGIGAGECLTTNFTFRAWLGRFVRRGELQVLVGRRGIYRTDQEQTGRSLEQLVEEAKLTKAAAGERLSKATIDHEMDLLRGQFANEKTWNATLEKAGTTPRVFRREVASNLRDRAWLEARLGPESPPNEGELRRFYDAHPELFLEPLRLRASHLFLAAPEGSPNEIIEGKRALIQALAQRLQNGESFSALVAEFSDDEATKELDGDLNYFAAARILPEVFNAAQALRPGETSAPLRSRLGFHLIRLTESRAPRTLDFAEARPEISAALADRKRVQNVRALLARIH